VALALFDEHGPTPPLEGEYICCVSCGWMANKHSPDLPKAERAGRAPCPLCTGPGEEWKGFTRHRHVKSEQTVDSRWPSAASAGWTPMPNAFHRNAKALGLDPADVGLIDLIETYRTSADDAVTVSYRKLANAIGSSPDTIGKRVNKWVQAGLFEKEHRQRGDGGNSTCSLTRRGLTRALAHIDANLAAKRPATEGLEALREALRPDRNLRVPPPAEHGWPHPQHAGAEEEGVEEEPLDEDLLTEREPEPRGPFLHEAMGGEEAAIFTLAAAFDATEVYNDDEPSGEAMCPYPPHRRSDWQTHGGRWVCGVCHPPAAADLVARRAA
jgi:hypothetical protein